MLDSAIQVVMMGVSVATLAAATFMAILGTVNLAFGLQGANEPQVVVGIFLIVIGVIGDSMAAISGRAR